MGEIYILYAGIYCCIVLNKVVEFADSESSKHASINAFYVIAYNTNDRSGKESHAPISGAKIHKKSHIHKFFRRNRK